MIRAAAAAVLVITLILLMQGISATWRQQIDLSPPAAKVKTAAAPDLAAIGKGIGARPKVPLALPDLKQGYLFNEERAVEDEIPEPEKEEFHGNDLGLNARVDDIQFSGAVIGKSFKIALISYPEATRPKKMGSKRHGRSAKSIAKRGIGGLKNARVKEGDLVNGYKVAAIYPDKIVFEKGKDTIEKFLYDPDKKRIVPKRASRSAPPPGRAVPRARAGTPAPPSPAGGEAPPLPPGIGRKLKGISSKLKITEGTRNRPRLPTKRIVVTRRPPPTPDTSRVSRRRRAPSMAPPVSSPSVTPFR